MAKIRKAVFRSGIVMMSLLAAIVLSSSVAWAQVCQATSDSNEVRAEGITEMVGTITLDCVVGTDPVFALSESTKLKINIKLNTDITNAVGGDGMVNTVGEPGEAIPADVNYDGGAIAVYATDQGGNSPVTGAVEFDDFELSNDGTDMTVEVTAIQANLNTTVAANGFKLIVGGIRANASRVGHKEDIEATVSLDGVVARRSPSKVADVTTGLEVEVTRQDGLMCQLPGERSTDEMATIEIKEGFDDAIGNMYQLALTFTQVPDGAMILLEEEITGAQTAGADTADTADDDEFLTVALVTAGRGSGSTRIRSGANSGKYMVDLSPTGTGAVVYTVTNPSASVDTLPDLNVYSVWEEGAVATGKAGVNVSYSPVLSLASGTIPRYMENSDSPEVLRVDSCDTSMMFPFLTNQAGYDTGVALTNPTKVDGSCSIELVANGRAAMTESMPIEAMSTIVFILSGMAAGFQGHAEASCSFTGGSAFVFISNGFQQMGGTTAAQGYVVKAE